MNLTVKEVLITFYNILKYGSIEMFAVLYSKKVFLKKKKIFKKAFDVYKKLFYRTYILTTKKIFVFFLLFRFLFKLLFCWHYVGTSITE